MQIESVGAKTQMTTNQQTQTRGMEGSPKKGQFDALLQTGKSQGTQEKMAEMIDTIEKLKHTLEYDLSVDNLMEYKEALKSFVDYYTKHELNVHDVLMTDRRGYTKKMQIVKEVNEKLNDMTSNMLETHLGHLQMLKDIDEIQGLVLNLYL